MKIILKCNIGLNGKIVLITGFDFWVPSNYNVSEMIKICQTYGRNFCWAIGVIMMKFCRSVRFSNMNFISEFNFAWLIIADLLLEFYFMLNMVNKWLSYEVDQEQPTSVDLSFLLWFKNFKKINIFSRNNLNWKLGYHFAVVIKVICATINLLYKYVYIRLHSTVCSD